MPSEIPLSFNALDTQALNTELQRWEGRSHDEILEAFEAKLCERTKSPYAVALNSGTAAIHLALRVAGVERGNRVAVSTFTYIGSVNPIRYLEAEPVLIDCEMDTWNMDPNLLEEWLKKSTKSSVPKVIEVVHTYGMPAKMDEIMEIANRFGVSVLEDAASGLGAVYNDNAVGTIGDIGVLSFNNNKTISTFGGGALLTRNKKIYEKVKFLATQARENKAYYEFIEVGYNYRMGPLNAVYGLSQLNGMKEKIAARRDVFDQYRLVLKDVSEIAFQNEPEKAYSSRWLTAILVTSGKLSSTTNESTSGELRKQNIESRYLWKPMHTQPLFKDAKKLGGSVSEMLFNTGLCLPSGPGLSASDMAKIAEVIKRTCSER